MYKNLTVKEKRMKYYENFNAGISLYNKARGINQSAQLDGFSNVIWKEHLDVNEMYKTIYRIIVKSLSFRRKKEDYFTAYEIGLWDGISEKTVMCYLDQINDDRLFDKYYQEGNRLFISLTVLY